MSCIWQPFWPTGSGTGRGFLTVLDAAWAMRDWCLGDKPPVQVVAERESVFTLLSHVQNYNLATTSGGRRARECLHPLITCPEL